MPLTNFADKVTSITHTWLNKIDVLYVTVFGEAATKAQARTAITSDAPFAITEGGTGATTVAGARTALNAASLAANTFTDIQSITNSIQNQVLVNATDGNTVVQTYANLGTGGVNPLSVAQDAGIFFNDSAVNTGKFVLGGWSTTSFGFRFDNVAKTITAAGDVNFTGTQKIESAVPKFVLNETGVTADNGRWQIIADGEVLYLQTVNDADSISAEIIAVQRTGTVVDSVALGGTFVNLSGTSFRIASTQVVGARRTGWSATTGTELRTNFGDASVADTSQALRALIVDLKAHGLIGA